jgi:hypothetical protein
MKLTACISTGLVREYMDKTLHDIIETEKAELDRMRGRGFPPQIQKAIKEKLKANDVQYGGDHYKKMGIQPWDVCDTWPLEQQIGAHRHGVLKYIMRLGTKDERLKEAQKVLHYAQKLVEVLEKADGADTRRKSQS